MKFTDGYWRVRDGVSLFCPAEARSATRRDASLEVFGPCKAIRHRTDTLNTPALTFTFRSPLEDVIHVRVVHFKGGREGVPVFELPGVNGHRVAVRETEETASLTAGRLAVHVRKRDGWGFE